MPDTNTDTLVKMAKAVVFPTINFQSCGGQSEEETILGIALLKIKTCFFLGIGMEFVISIVVQIECCNYRLSSGAEFGF